MASIEGCYYVGYGGWAFGWTQMIPVAVTLVCTILTTATHQPLYFLFSTFLYIPQASIWCFQAYFQMEMPDPVCQLYHTWSFPSVPAFYVGVAVAAFVTVSLLWQFDHSWIIWLFMHVFGMAPALILVWFGYNRWWEVALSLGYGVCWGVLFGIVMYYYVEPVMPFLQYHFPFRDFGYRDTICLKSSQCDQVEKVCNTLDQYFRLIQSKRV